MSKPEMIWERLPGRCWQVTIWRPGERERSSSLYEALRNYGAQTQDSGVDAQMLTYRGMPSLGRLFACPHCGALQRQQASALESLGGIWTLFR